MKIHGTNANNSDFYRHVNLNACKALTFNAEQKCNTHRVHTVRTQLAANHAKTMGDDGCCMFGMFAFRQYPTNHGQEHVK